MRIKRTRFCHSEIFGVGGPKRTRTPSALLLFEFRDKKHPTKNPTHQREPDKPKRHKTTRRPEFSRHHQPDQHCKTVWSSLLINRFRVQVPAGAPSSRRREVWLRDLLEDRTPTQVLVLVDLAGRETLVENPHRIEPLTPGAVLTTFPVTAVATVSVMAALPVIVPFVLLAAVAMPLAAANSGDRAKERDKR
jgi:hypothetical protein